MNRSSSDGSDTAADATVATLADRRARLVVSVLLAAERPLPLPVLAKRVTAHEREQDDAAVTRQAIQRTYLSLYHDHIPALTASELVTYHEDDGTVDVAGPPERVRTLLTAASARRPRK